MRNLNNNVQQISMHKDRKFLKELFTKVDKLDKIVNNILKNQQ